jgi:hypothetical protein
MPARDAEAIELASAQRAKGEIRRQIRANRGRFLWTFTYKHGVYSYEQVVRDAGAFLRRLRRLVGDVWFVLVPEPHPGGHGYHLHGSAAIRLPIAKVRKAWGKGHVWVGDHKRQHKRWTTRHLSRYLAKYATKMVGGSRLYGCGGRPRGAHRYWVTQGREPECVRCCFPTLALAHDWLRVYMGAYEQCRLLELGPDVPIEGWWLSYSDEWLAPPPGGC